MLTILKDLKVLYSKSKKEAEELNSQTKTFTRIYNFKKGLYSNHQPLKKLFSKDVNQWASEWEEPLDRYELFNAKIIISYIKKGEMLTISDSFKYYTDTLLPTEERLLRFKSFLMLSIINHRRVPMQSIRTVKIELEWYNYSKDIQFLQGIIEQEELK